MGAKTTKQKHGSRKVGNHKVDCERYRGARKQERNHARKIAKHILGKGGSDKMARAAFDRLRKEGFARKQDDARVGREA